ncbi:MAG: (Fe-S)-binding protein [Bacteroidota bacterium]|nr:(Fe-S)-binding protein [Bacteroidota bacterium]
MSFEISSNTAQQPRKLGSFAGVDIPNYDFITNCMHCGLCLPTCPTYALTGLERSSPRGRIRLIKSIADGGLEMTQTFIDEMNFCLDCQACETACPAGVKYGALVEAARAQIFQKRVLPVKERFLKWVLLKNILSSKWKLKTTAALLRVYQRWGIEALISKFGILKIFSSKLNDLQSLAPRIDVHYSEEIIPEILAPKGEAKYRAGFLSGCLMNVAFAGINKDTVDVLLHNGCEVITPREQECCGSLQAHSGDFETARRLARHNVDVFSQYELGAIVMNSAGCGAFMKEYGHYLKDDPEYSEKARILSSKIKDVSEFLANIEFKIPTEKFNKRVAYHDACHLAHAQKITAEPRKLLGMIPGIDLVELPEANWCCGSAGIYNVVHYDDSMKLLDRKMENVRTTGAEIIVANNPGCLGQMQYGAKKFGIDVEIIHFATLLKRAYRLGN